MSEIEKAREFLDSRWNKHIGGLFGGAREITTGVENLAVAVMTEYGNRIRAIAREEIKAAKGYKPQPGDRDFDMPGVTPAPKVDAGTGVSAVTTPATGASGFAIPGDSFNQEGGDPHSAHGRPAEHAGDKSPPAVEAPAAGDEVAKRAYVEMTDNHPTMHSNRFPSWEELDEAERQKWRDKVQPSAMTALARRLAEALRGARERLVDASKEAAASAYAYQMAGKIGQSHYLDQHRAALDIVVDQLALALAEARKHKLIE